MSFCPMDSKPCCDDLCHGGGCIRSGLRDEMLRRCSGCRTLVGESELRPWSDVCDICADAADNSFSPDDWDDDIEAANRRVEDTGGDEPGLAKRGGEETG